MDQHDRKISSNISRQKIIINYIIQSKVISSFLTKQYISEEQRAAIMAAADLKGFPFHLN